MIYRMIELLRDWELARLREYVFKWLSDEVIEWLRDWMTGCLEVCLIDWLCDRFFVWLFVVFVGEQNRTCSSQYSTSRVARCRKLAWLRSSIWRLFHRVFVKNFQHVLNYVRTCWRWQFYETRDAQLQMLHQYIDLVLALAMGTFTENPYARMTILWNKRRTNVDFSSKCWFGVDVGDVGASKRILVREWKFHVKF